MKKLRSNKGESIAEALAALLVAVLGGLMVAGAVTSSNKSMAKTDALMRSYYSSGRSIICQKKHINSSIENK